VSPPVFHAQGGLAIGREDVHRIAARAEAAAVKVRVVALVKDIGQMAQQALPPEGRAATKLHHVLPYSSGEPML